MHRREFVIRFRDSILAILLLPVAISAAEPGQAIFNDVLEAMATFREVHYGWAQQYIERHVADPRGTGGTPYSQWLKQLIDETRAAKIA